MVRATKKGTWGTYALRIMERRAKDPAETINPLDQIVQKLIKATSDGNPYQANYELGVAEPFEDLDPPGQFGCELPTFNVARDGACVSNIPCLSHLSFKLTARRRVDLTAIYRSHYYAQRARGNLIGLSQLLGFAHLRSSRRFGKKATRRCPCGHLGSPLQACRCTPDAVARYQGRISGPLLDRIDLRVEVPAASPQTLAAGPLLAGSSQTAVQTRRRKPAIRGRSVAGIPSAPGRTACGRVPVPTNGSFLASRSGQVESHSLSLDHRRSFRLPLTAIASARFWPTRTTRRFPRVMPV